MEAIKNQEASSSSTSASDDSVKQMLTAALNTYGQAQNASTSGSTTQSTFSSKYV